MKRALLPATLDAPSHHRDDHPAVTMTAVLVTTVQVSGAGMVGLTMSRAVQKPAAFLCMTRDEARELIGLLRNAIDDADRVERGLRPEHVTGYPLRWSVS